MVRKKMEELLAQVVEEWANNNNYYDVSGKLWIPGSPRLERCPDGCHLDIYELPKKWERIRDIDAYRQTRICKVHRFARIYILSEAAASTHEWDLSRT